MNIIIRSQDKKSLIEPHRIIITHNFPTNKFRITNQVLYSYEADDYDVLGEYETEAQVLWVLEQIEKILSQQVDAPCPLIAPYSDDIPEQIYRAAEAICIALTSGHVPFYQMPSAEEVQDLIDLPF